MKRTNLMKIFGFLAIMGFFTFTVLNYMQTQELLKEQKKYNEQQMELLNKKYAQQQLIDDQGNQQGQNQNVNNAVQNLFQNAGNVNDAQLLTNLLNLGLSGMSGNGNAGLNIDPNSLNQISGLITNLMGSLNDPNYQNDLQQMANIMQSFMNFSNGNFNGNMGGIPNLNNLLNPTAVSSSNTNSNGTKIIDIPQKKDDIDLTDRDVFEYPKIKGYHIDYCLHKGKFCGETVALAFCRSNKYTKAIKFKKASNLGPTGATYLMGDKKLCDSSKCDGFLYIKCGN